MIILYYTECVMWFGKVPVLFHCFVNNCNYLRKFADREYSMCMCPHACLRMRIWSSSPDDVMGKLNPLNNKPLILMWIYRLSHTRSGFPHGVAWHVAILNCWLNKLIRHCLEQLSASLRKWSSLLLLDLLGFLLFCLWHHYPHRHRLAPLSATS